MKARSSRRLERENREQLATILQLCQKLSLLSVVGPFPADPTLVNEKITQLSEIIVDRRDICEDRAHEQIRILERELANKRQQHDELATRIQEYLQSARAVDAELSEQHAETHAIIEEFQRRKSSGSTSLTLSQLEEENQQKKVELQKLQKENEDARQLCLAARDHLKESHERTRALHMELTNVQGKLSRMGGKDAQIEKIRLNEATIEGLQNELKKLKAQVRTLNVDNQFLKRLLPRRKDDQD
jgi:DNA repair exonuclease SbcCD ATPase subunit